MGVPSTATTVALLLVAGGCGFDASGGADDGDGTTDDGSGADAGIRPADAAREPDAGPPPPCEAPWVAEPTGCHLYVKETAATFEGAELDCQGRGGHLVVEDVPGEPEAIAAGMAPLGELDRFWIGLHDPPPDDNVFVWVSGAPLLDPNWGGLEPSNSGDCVNGRPDGTWGDRLCSDVKWFVCEKND